MPRCASAHSCGYLLPGDRRRDGAPRRRCAASIDRRADAAPARAGAPSAGGAVGCRARRVPPGDARGVGRDDPEPATPPGAVMAAWATAAAPAKRGKPLAMPAAARAQRGANRAGVRWRRRVRRLRGAVHSTSSPDRRADLRAYAEGTAPYVGGSGSPYAARTAPSRQLPAQPTGRVRTHADASATPISVTLALVATATTRSSIRDVRASRRGPARTGALRLRLTDPDDRRARPLTGSQHRAIAGRVRVRRRSRRADALYRARVAVFVHGRRLYVISVQAEVGRHRVRHARRARSASPCASRRSGAAPARSTRPATARPLRRHESCRSSVRPPPDAARSGLRSSKPCARSTRIHSPGGSTQSIGAVVESMRPRSS